MKLLQERIEKFNKKIENFQNSSKIENMRIIRLKLNKGIQKSDIKDIYPIEEEEESKVDYNQSSGRFLDSIRKNHQRGRSNELLVIPNDEN